MAKKGSKGQGRLGQASGGSQAYNPKAGVWTKRDTSTGRFTQAKKSGGSFKGVRREN
jgi:hypothetical protein